MLIAAWNMLTNGDFYRDPGADYYTRRQPTKSKARAIAQLEALGFHVDVQPLAATAWPVGTTERNPSVRW